MSRTARLVLASAFAFGTFVLGPTPRPAHAATSGTVTGYP